jgi:hypothetical protein
MITRRRVSTEGHTERRGVYSAHLVADGIDLTWPSARLARLPDDYLVAGGFFYKFYQLSVNVARLAFSEANRQKSLAEMRQRIAYFDPRTRKIPHPSWSRNKTCGGIESTERTFAIDCKIRQHVQPGSVLPPPSVIHHLGS